MWNLLVDMEFTLKEPHYMRKSERQLRKRIYLKSLWMYRLTLKRSHLCFNQRREFGAILRIQLEHIIGN